jgi:hypothetical protein
MKTKITIKKEIIFEPVGNYEKEAKAELLIAKELVKYCDYCVGSIDDADDNADEILKQLGINPNEL